MSTKVCLVSQSVQSLSRVWLFVTTWIAARQASLSITNSRSLLKTHVHRVGDAIHPLSSPSPPAPKPSKHQGLFQWVNSSHEVAKVLEFQLQHQSFQWTPRTYLLQDGLIGSPCSPSSQGYGYFSSHIWMWELDYKESCAPKNWCFWTTVLEKTLRESLELQGDVMFTTWVWVNSGSWWWTGRPGVLQSMGLQRVGLDLNWTEFKFTIYFIFFLSGDDAFKFTVFPSKVEIEEKDEIKCM